jgi:hypothetical protein
MNDEDVSRMLRRLPREEPSRDFTARVLAKVDARSRVPRSSGALTYVWVGGLLLGVFLAQGYIRERYRQSKAATRIQELRDEYRELEGELEKLRALTQELEPVLDLGGTEDVEFVFDLRELAREEAGGRRAQPISHAPSKMEERRP